MHDGENVSLDMNKSRSVPAQFQHARDTNKCDVCGVCMYIHSTPLHQFHFSMVTTSVQFILHWTGLRNTTTENDNRVVDE